MARSQTNTVFLSSAWLRAACEAECCEKDVVTVAFDRGGTLVAGAILVVRRGRLEFLGSGSSDYLDVVVDRSLSELEAAECTAAIVAGALRTSPGAKSLVLRNIPDEGGTPRRLASLGKGLWVTRLRTLEAPSMDIGAAGDALRKKSLRRHENGLARVGKVEVVSLTRPEDVLPRLPGFFDQHVRRWADTSYPSLFHDAGQRDLYGRLVRNLGARGWLRYTEVRLDSRMVAAHLGTFYGGRFTWYKPTFEPELAHLSPGEVLLKRLIEQAVEEGAEEFDFTIGGEAFKKRFATHIRTVGDFHVTRSRALALALRSRLAAKRHLRSALTALGVWVPLKSAFHNVLRPRRHAA